MAETEVTPEELSLAKESLIRSLPGDFETSASAASTLSNLYIYSLGLDYYAQLPGRVSSVIAADVLVVSRKYLVPAKMIVVAIGDRGKIEPELMKLNLGAIEIRDADGNVTEKKPTQ